MTNKLMNKLSAGSVRRNAWQACACTNANGARMSEYTTTKPLFNNCYADVRGFKYGTLQSDFAMRNELEYSYLVHVRALDREVAAMCGCLDSHL